MNETRYMNMYSQVLEPANIAIQAICKNYTFSELYEIVALCNVLKCNIRSIYPKIDFQEYMVVMNTVFTPASPTIANYEIIILWSHMKDEKNAREENHGAWSPNHFVPLMSSTMYYDFEGNNQSASTVLVDYYSVNKISINFQFFLDS